MDTMSRMHRMHSAEHLLTAVMRRDFGSPRNIEMHLGPKKSKCDYEISRPFTDDDLAAVESAVNDEIERDLAVTAETIPVDEATERYDLWKVPEGAASIRIVHMGDLTSMPCSGDHVARTIEIGRFRAKSFTMKTDRIVRIRYKLEG